MFDPYYKWLGIRPEHQPPDHYRLLGLERFESDRDVILAAGERQMAHVQSYKIGPQSELSQKILNEIARAKVCLLNAASKAQYDTSLRAAEASRVVAPPAVTPTARQPAIQQATQPASPASPPPVQHAPVQHAPAVDLDAIDLSDSRRRSEAVEKTRSQRKPNNQLSPSVLIIAAGALCLFIVIAIAFLMNSTGRGTAQQPRGPRTTEKPAFVASDDLPAADSPAVDVPSPLESPAATDLTGRGIRRNPNRSLPTPGADSRHPIPTNEEIQQAKSQFTIQGRLTPTVTLATSHNATHPATRYALFQMTIELAQQADREAWPEATRCALEAARMMAAGYQVPPEFYPAIESQFQRRPPASSAPSGIGKLRMPIQSDPSPADPNVLVIDAPLIDLTKAQTEVKFKPTAQFESRKLLLTGLGATGAVLVRQYPDSGQVEIGTPIRVVLRDEPPRAGLEVSLRGTDELSVRIKPMIQDPDDVFYPWTDSGVRTVRGKVNRSVKNLNRDIERDDELVANLTEQTSALRNTSASTSNRAAVANRLKAAEADLAQHSEELRKLEQFLHDLEDLEELFGQIDRKARLTFRVVQTNDGQEVPLVQTNP